MIDLLLAIEEQLFQMQNNNCMEASIARLLMMGRPFREIITGVANNGIEPIDAERLLEQTVLNCLLELNKLKSQHRSLTSIFEAQKIFSTNVTPKTITTITASSDISPLDEIFDSKPIIIKNFNSAHINDNALMPDNLISKFGDFDVEVTRQCKRENNLSSRGIRETTTVNLRDFILGYCNNADELYMMGSNRNLEVNPLTNLKKSLSLSKMFFSKPRHGEIGLWISPCKSLTNLHYDRRNTILYQVFGRKEILFLSPYDTPKLGEIRAYYSEFGSNKTKLQELIDENKIDPIFVTLHPGDAVYIPATWWHKVESSGLNVSVSLSNLWGQKELNL